MCVLQLRKIDFCKFSVWSVRTASLCVRTGVDQTAEWYSYTSGRVRVK
jgi:hypothetical protein